MIIDKQKEDIRNKNLIKNTIIVAIGQICTKFISFFLLPIYTAYLKSSEYGIVDLLNTIIALIIPIISLQIEQAVFRFLIDARKNKERTEIIISTSIIVSLIQTIIFIIFFFIITFFWKNEYRIFLLLNVIVSMIASILLQIARGIGNNLLYSIGSVISGSGSIIFNILFIIIFKMNAYGMLIGTFIGNLLSIIVLVYKLKLFKIVKLNKVNKNILIELLKYSLPLIPNAISWWIVNASDRVIISQFLGVDSNGAYSAVYKFPSICITVFNIFSLTWTESASLHYKDKDKDEYYSKIFNTTMKFFTYICIGITSIMSVYFKFFIRGESYINGYYQIPILMMATIFNIMVSMYGTIYIASKKSSEIAKTSIYSAIINILVNLALIKFIGLYAASVSTLVAYLLMTIYRHYHSKKYIQIKLDKTFILISILLYMIILYTYYQDSHILKYISILLTMIIGVFYNFSTIKRIIKAIKNKLNNKNIIN